MRRDVGGEEDRSGLWEDAKAESASSAEDPAAANFGGNGSGNSHPGACSTALDVDSVLLSVKLAACTRFLPPLSCIRSTQPHPATCRKKQLPPSERDDAACFSDRYTAEAVVEAVFSLTCTKPPPAPHHHQSSKKPGGKPISLGDLCLSPGWRGSLGSKRCRVAAGNSLHPCVV